MTLPDFLVIGAARAGTTWLDGVLRSHPDIYLPTSRKEVHFFDAEFDRGVEWYERFFDQTDASHRRVGESTPRYMYDKNVPGRIEVALGSPQLIVILRHPTDRTYSHHGLAVRDRAGSLDFEQALQENPHLTAMSRYGEQLERYIDRFGRDRLHVVIFEEAVAESEAATRSLGEFLGVDPQGFEVDASVANASFVPRHPRARRGLKLVAKQLRRRGLDGVAEWGRKNVGDRAGKAGSAIPPIPPVVRDRLDREFADDITAVEQIIGRRIAAWERRPHGN